ncbi:MAG: right-handed parallel beta-helix repeat-containing protein, partial [Steroidobacteraceae bacterium]
LIGPFTAAATTLTAGASYQVLGTLFVGTGKSLTIPAGTTLRFNGSETRLIVDGTLNVQGTSGSLVTLTSGRATPARGDWRGILLRSGSAPLIEYALIEWAVRGVELVSGASATIRNSTIRNFSDSGIYMTGTTAATLLSGNTIDDLNDQSTCLYLNSASPTLQGNTVRNCFYGVFFNGNSSAALNSGNVITSNTYGLYLQTQTPQPVVTGNQIFGNTQFDYYTASFASGAQNVVLNATGNWWGTTDASAISAKINDLTDSYTSTQLPTVDYSGFLDGPNGTPVPGNYLIGPFTAAATTLTAGASYQVLGTLFVGTGKSLTIPAGTTLRFYVPQSRLVVDGSLAIQGTESSPVRVISGLTDPVPGAWQGIEVRSTATSVLIDNAIVESAVRAISVTGTNATIRNSIIRSFTDAGIWMSGVGSSSQILNNYIDNFDGVTGYGIYLTASSPAITGNQIYRTSIGIYAVGASNPSITGNAISNNGRGIVLDGNNSNSASAVPNP